MAYTIGIDLTFIKDDKKAVGNEISALSIVEGIYKNAGKNDFIIFACEKNAEQLKEKYPLFNIVSTKSGRRFYKKFLPWYLKNNKIDIIYYPQYSKLLNFKLKAKIVMTSHGIIRRDDFLISDKLLKYIMKRVNKIIAVSDFVKRELTEKKGFDPEKIYVIPNPLAYMDEIRDLVYKKKHIVAVGNDQPQKNIMLIVKAFEKLVDKIEHDLVLIGDISQKGEIYRYLVDTGLSDRVVVTGKVGRDTLFGYYKNTDLFVNASRYEGFGLAPLEAMVYQVPVLSTPVPSISEIGNVSFDGNLTFDSNEQEIADKMLALLNSQKDLESLKRRSEGILDYFSLDSIGKKYIQVFENV